MSGSRLVWIGTTPNYSYLAQGGCGEIERATRPRPSAMLKRHADEILTLAHRHRISNVRVFGSSVHGTDTADSDVDLLVSFGNDKSLFDVAGSRSLARSCSDIPSMS